MKILILPMDGVGHVNACLGLGCLLNDFGHEVTFGVLINFKPLLEKYPQFAVECYEDVEDEHNQDFLSKWGNFMKKRESMFMQDPIEQKSIFFAEGLAEFQRFARSVNQPIEELIAKVCPDLMVVDFYVTLPAVANSKIPWVMLLSANPLRIYEPLGAPPSSLGHSTLNPDPEKLKKDLEISRSLNDDMFKDHYEWLKSKGIVSSSNMKVDSPHLNIYVYPADLDYDVEFGKLENWHRLEHLVRPVEDSPIGVDPEFFKTHGKIVYFSLGSLGTSGIDLMKRLISYMGKSKHKFVVSKGPFHGEIQLPPNMVGAKFINQLKVISNVDLIVTHGGNNTLIEALYYGKPLIVIPLFGDQHDNGRRVVEKNIGKCLYPSEITEENLLAAIDQMLMDAALHERLALISERIKASKSSQELNEKLKDLINKAKVSSVP